jgi:ATP-dependent protease ClpP protease subunit
MARKPLLRSAAPLRANSADTNQKKARIEKSGRTAIVHVFDYIDWLGFDVAFYGPQLDAMRDIDTIVVRINSPGGSAYDGVAFYNVLVSHPAKTVRVEVLGLAGSAASVIAMAGDQILMGTAARLFIHKPWMVAAGNDAVFQRYAAELASMNEDFVSLYAQQAKKLSREHIMEIMAGETELSADDAIAKGFATGRLNKADEVKAAPAPAYGHLPDSAALRSSLESRHALTMRPHDPARPALSAARREADILKAQRPKLRAR